MEDNTLDSLVMENPALKENIQQQKDFHKMQTS